MNILSEIVSSPWFIEAGFASQYAPIVANMLKGEAPHFLPEKAAQTQISFLNGPRTWTVDVGNILDYLDEIEEPSAFIVHIVGPITKYDQYCGPSGMAAKTAWLKIADQHPNIVAHVLKLDSGGGSGFAARLMSECISELTKPVYAFIDDLGASAAYWIASSAKAVISSSTMTRVGSIGTYLSVADYSKYFEQQGIRITDVYAKASSDKNQDYLRAIKGDTKMVQQLANEYNQFFLSHVRNQRRGKLKNSTWDSGKMFFAKEAQTIGLVDDVMSFEQCVEGILLEHTKKK